jgi:hypothetical protein
MANTEKEILGNALANVGRQIEDAEYAMIDPCGIFDPYNRRGAELETLRTQRVSLQNKIEEQRTR